MADEIKTDNPNYPYQREGEYYEPEYARSQGFKNCASCGQAAGAVYYHYEGFRGFWGVRTYYCPSCSQQKTRDAQDKAKSGNFKFPWRTSG